MRVRSEVRDVEGGRSVRRSPPRAGSCAGGAAIVAAALLAAGCGGGGGGTSQATSSGVLPADQRSIEARPGVERTVEESDIFKLEGSSLLVQNPSRGFARIDVSDPDRPGLAAQLTSLVGVAGEIHLASGTAFVVFKEDAVGSERASVVAVVSATASPRLGGSVTLPGRLVASRLVGGLLYLVTTDAIQTWVSSVPTANPLALSVAGQVRLAGAADEVHVTDAAVWVAQPTGEWVLGTRLRAIDISDLGGAVVARGEIRLAGQPQGRFHMDASGTMFRIVTYGFNSSNTLASNLYVIDARDLDRLAILGSLEGFAPREEMHGTRFDGDRVYVVTFLRRDPLWVISLADPARPAVLGELEVPGWSDYIYPRGDRLLAVGRGDFGQQVQVELFDIHDLASPRMLSAVKFGVPQATAEANADFRGVRVIEAGPLGTTLVAVPYTDNFLTSRGCVPEHRVQLIDLEPDALVLRGAADATGLVRRTVPIGTRLYAISDKTVAALDVTSRDAPTATAILAVGDLAAADACTPAIGVFTTGFFDAPVPLVCRAGGRGSPDGLIAPLAVGVALFRLLRRRFAKTRLET